MRFINPQLRLQNVRPIAGPNLPDNSLRDLQNDLNTLGYAAGEADGLFGKLTLAAVRSFQQDARGTLRQEQSGKQLTEDPPLYTGGVTGVVDEATALEIQRWKQKRWQRPRRLALAVEDVRSRLPINPRLTPRIRRPSDIDRLVLHCTDAPPTWNVFKCAEYDVHPNHISAKGCPTITYTYFVNADGSVQKCLSHDVVSWHAGEWNTRGLGVVLAYRATGNSAPPPRDQLEAASELFARLCATFGLQAPANVVGHRELLNTGYTLDANGRKHLRKECPGMLIDLDEFRQEIGRRAAGLANSPVSEGTR